MIMTIIFAAFGLILYDVITTLQSLEAPGTGTTQRDGHERSSRVFLDTRI